jgi:cell division protein FtsB
MIDLDDFLVALKVQKKEIEDLRKENDELKRYVRELQEKLLMRDISSGHCSSTKYS